MFVIYFQKPIGILQNKADLLLIHEKVLGNK